MLNLDYIYGMEYDITDSCDDHDCENCELINKCWEAEP